MFKDILFELRKDKGISQEELASNIGVTRSTVGMYEQGRRIPSYEIMEVIADFFNVDMDYLYGKSEIKNKYNLDYLKEEYNLDYNLARISKKDCELDKEFIPIYVELSEKQKMLLLDMARQMKKE